MGEIQCVECGAMVERRKMGPHVSGHRRTQRAKYVYPNGSKSPHVWVVCQTCGQQGLQKLGTRFCSASCSKVGELNPRWKGNDARPNSARMRAHRLYANDICSRCGSVEHVQRHHRDRNTYNNTAGNIEILCAKCHSLAHRQPRPICPICGAECSGSKRTYCSPACWGKARAMRRAS